MTMRLVVAAAVLVGLGSAVARADWDEAVFQTKTVPSYTLPTDGRGVPLDTLIGGLQTYRIRKGDTLMDLARYYDLGYNEIVEANPGIDPWTPAVGATIVLPTQWVLPCCSYQGVVVNIPEMRLFLYKREKGAQQLTVVTYPVGLGRDDWPTPRAKFKIRGKTYNPQWNIPESIRKEHIEERGDPRTFIAGGDPENPLGRHRIELTLPMYAIHGTNIPWGVGMQVSHGCVRLYPEDIERLFPQVGVGSPGEFTYQQVKVGTLGDAVYMEVQEDVYGLSPSLWNIAMEATDARGLGGRVDQTLVEDVLTASGGIPFRVSSAQEGAPLTLAGTWRPVGESKAIDRALNQDDPEEGDD